MHGLVDLAVRTLANLLRKEVRAHLIYLPFSIDYISDSANMRSMLSISLQACYVEEDIICVFVRSQITPSGLPDDAKTIRS